MTYLNLNRPIQWYRFAKFTILPTFGIFLCSLPALHQEVRQCAQLGPAREDDDIALDGRKVCKERT